MTIDKSNQLTVEGENVLLVQKFLDSLIDSNSFELIEEQFTNDVRFRAIYEETPSYSEGLSHEPNILLPWPAQYFGYEGIKDFLRVRKFD